MTYFDPQQELFTALYMQLGKAFPQSVYEGVLPPEGTPYPFVYLGETQAADDFRLKDAVMGTITQTVHLFDRSNGQRGSLSQMALTIKTACRSLETGRTFHFDLNGVTQQVLTDTTAGTPLTHIVLDLSFRFYRR